MEKTTVTLDLPSADYDFIKKIAQSTHQSVTDVVRQSVDFLTHLPPIVGDVEPILKSLSSCSDVQLWGVVYRHLSPTELARLHELSDKSEEHSLSPEEDALLDHLVALVDRHALLRSEALVLLKRRGHDIEQFLSKWKIF